MLPKQSCPKEWGPTALSEIYDHQEEEEPRRVVLTPADETKMEMDGGIIKMTANNNISFTLRNI